MKKIALTFFLIFISINAIPQNVVYLVFQPCDMGVGLRYDRQKYDLGSYMSLTRGKYSFDDGYIKDHYKLSSGGIYKNFTLGLCYNKYGEAKGSYGNALKPISLELGAKALLDKLCVALRFDVVKFEGSWEFGINF